ncbi:MAG: site-2 protease family protein [Planctomycetota bacterium]|jgi:Zn-dependent protease|nr:site-2 protease family protein [Planctomycetota bacterium]
MNFLLASHRFGRFFGIETRIAYSLYFVAGLFFLQLAGRSLPLAAVVLLLPVFVLAHEIGHALAARRYAVFVDSITLHALGGVSSLRGRIPGASAELAIAVAGPAVSLALGAAGFALAAYGNFLPPLARGVAYYAGWQNLILGLFNLLPIFPLDGGRIALAFGVMLGGLEKALKIVRPMTVVGAGLLALYGVYEIVNGQLGGIFMLLIGYLIWTQGAQEWQARGYAAQYAYYQPARSNLPRADRPNGWWARWRVKRREAQAAQVAAAREKLNRNVDEILKKVHRDGIGKLTLDERALLMRASEKYRQEQQK